MLERPMELVKDDSGVVVPVQPRPLPDGFGGITLSDCVARLGTADAPRVRRPFDAGLIKLASIARDPSRLSTELTPEMAELPNNKDLEVKRLQFLGTAG